MDSRALILERIRHAVGREQATENIDTAFQALCQKEPDTAVQPFLNREEKISRFVDEARRNGAVVAEMQGIEEVVAWLQSEADLSTVTPTLSLSPGVSALRKVWGSLGVSTQPPQPIESWGLVRAHTAIAETGTVMSLSRECPSSLLFLVERLIVLINKKDIVRFQEDAWDRLLDNQIVPRTVNLITGPSRTADIEQQIQIGAHGPRRTDYLIVESVSAKSGDH